MILGGGVARERTWAMVPAVFTGSHDTIVITDVLCFVEALIGIGETFS